MLYEGCVNCGDQGYRGRTALMEVLTVDDEVRRAIYRNALTDEIKEAAQRAGMATLFEDGLAKAAEGITSLAEVLRVTRGVKIKGGEASLEKLLFDKADAAPQKRLSGPAAQAESVVEQQAPATRQRRVVVRSPAAGRQRRVIGPGQE